MPLVETARIRSGDNVLILRATGAVGQIAVQAKKSLRDVPGQRNEVLADLISHLTLNSLSGGSGAQLLKQTNSS